MTSSSHDRVLHKLAALLLLAIGYSALCFGQHEHSTINQPQPIRGSEHPDLISDDVAFRLFFKALWIPESAPAKEVLRQRAKLAEAHLSTEDADAVFRCLAAFGASLRALEAEESTLRLSNEAKGLSITSDVANKLLAKRDTLVSSTTESLREQLSQEGMAQLTVLVRSEKKNMTLFFTPDMSVVPGATK